MKSNNDSRRAAKGVWEKVLNVLGDCRGLSILDAPAGGGELSVLIAARGARVVSLDIRPTHTDAGNSVKSDLNQPLPFANEEFDRIVCVEGVEHIENPFAILREFSRILKKNSFLVLTTPNIINIRSRIKFFATGVHFWFGKLAAKRFGHITPLSIYQLDFIREQAGFARMEVDVNRQILWMRLLMPVFRLVGFPMKEKYNLSRLLCGEIFVLTLYKE